MNTSKLAKLLAQDNDRSVISTLQGLLFLMKKFGKSLNTTAMLSFLSQSHPDIVQLYSLLGKSRCSVTRCQQLLVSVARLLDYNHLDVISFHDIASVFSADLLSGDVAEYITSDTIGLSVVGKGNRVYKRNLSSDLMKMTK